jgi:hypothetical protein
MMAQIALGVLWAYRLVGNETVKVSVGAYVACVDLWISFMI